MLLGTAALLPSVSRGQQSLPFASAWKTLRTPKAVPLGREVGWAELRGAGGPQIQQRASLLWSPPHDEDGLLLGVLWEDQCLQGTRGPSVS